MREFTATEIDLCKKIAEKGLMVNMKKGDWYWSEDWKAKELIIAGMTIKNQKLMKCFKLWAVSDCFEWLKERSYILRLSYQKDLMKKDIEIPNETYNGEYISREIFIRGYYFMEKPLEALLRAVLAILEEK